MDAIKLIRQLLVLIVGLIVLIIGVAMILLPGPAFIVVPLGLGILATEFVWARQILKKYKAKAKPITDKLLHKWSIKNPLRYL
jgi:tellurite resistance protein TerC